MRQLTSDVEIRHFHLFCGLGGGAMGFNKGKAKVGNMRARFRCIGGVDVDPAAIRDFSRNVGVAATVLDMFDREQYAAFHGEEPPETWREATPADLRRAASNQHPHIVFLSAPCKGFSGLLSETRSRDAKYQALNRLTVRGIWLMLEAFGDNPPELILFENVPRIANRGKLLLDAIEGLLRNYGYAVVRTTHDCGELGGLAQSRKRFLLVARHVPKVPAFIYQPPKRPLRAVGDVLGRMPLPGDPAGGPMHNIPNLQWKTWVRLAFVEAGSDWRSLNKLRVVDGALADFMIVPEMYGDVMGVLPWDKPAGTITGMAHATRGKFSVADPRFEGEAYRQYGVLDWKQPSATVTSQRSPGQGPFAVSDPRIQGLRHNNIFRIVRWAENSPAVTAGGHPTSGGIAVADPRPPAGPMFSKYMVTRWESNAGTVIGGDAQGAYVVADPRIEREVFSGYGVAPWNQPGRTVAGESFPSNGEFAVADPRIGIDRKRGDNYLTAGFYGVVPWHEASGAVSASACHDNGHWSVADPRMPTASDKLIAVIRSLDGTWHRPFTTLELAALQSLVDPERPMDFDGSSDSAKRERIGNAVPPGAAQAIADLMGKTLLLSWTSSQHQLDLLPVWVHPVAIALSVKGPNG